MATKRHFIKRKIKVTTAWVDDHPEVVDLAKEHGLHLEAPVVVIRNDSGQVVEVWTNYRRELIDAWAEGGSLPPLDD